MLIGAPSGTTRICGRSQGYKGLPVRDQVMVDKATGRQVNVMVTAWIPTPDELAALNVGASVLVEIFGVVPPLMRVVVGDKPE